LFWIPAEVKRIPFLTRTFFHLSLWVRQKQCQFPIMLFMDMRCYTKNMKEFWAVTGQKWIIFFEKNIFWSCQFACYHCCQNCWCSEAMFEDISKSVYAKWDRWKLVNMWHLNQLYFGICAFLVVPAKIYGLLGTGYRQGPYQATPDSGFFWYRKAESRGGPHNIKRKKKNSEKNVSGKM